MNRAEENILLTRVGPGTPMGELMRQYWLPAVMSSELTPDGDPMRVKLLCEELLAFRTTSGEVAVMDHRCPHRCASLFYGRNEGDGIRCVYHGWKFAADGTCVDQPNVDRPPGARIPVRAKAYPTTELCGVVWVYMGKRKTPPPLPDFPVFHLPDEQVAVWCAQRECNFLQAIEGEIDTSHAAFLHLGKADAAGMAQAGQSAVDLENPRVRYKIANKEFGVLSGAYRQVADEKTYWRYANFLFPFYTQIPPVPLGTDAFARAWVPMDDTHTMLFSISSTTYFGVGDRGKQPMARKPMPVGISFDYEFLPNTTDWYGRWRLASNKGNDHRIDREAQRTSSYTGIEGLEIQDMAICESMGPITDHTFEHLTQSDMAVVAARRALSDAAVALRDQDRTPPGVDAPETYWQWSGFLTVPREMDWEKAYNDNIPKPKAPAPVEAAE